MDLYGPGQEVSPDSTRGLSFGVFGRCSSPLFFLNNRCRILPADMNHNSNEAVDASVK